MRIEETSALLAKIQAFDNRNVDEAALAAWFEILEPHTLQDCLAAVTGYFRVNTSWIMPAHVVERVRDMEEVRIRKFRYASHLNEAEERIALGSGEWSKSMEGLQRAIATGHLTPDEYEAYQAGDQPLMAFLTRKAISQ